MVYTTVRQSPMYHQMTLEEFLFGKDSQAHLINSNVSNTRTYVSEQVSQKILAKVSIKSMVLALKEFNRAAEVVRQQPRVTLYNTFYQPKRDKGMKSVFDAFFKSQNRYVECDAKAVCRVISEGLKPLLRQHPTQTHEDLFSEAESYILSKLSQSGFDVSKIDMNACIKAGFRRIDAPNYSLKIILANLKDLLEGKCGALYHTSAFAYIKDRSTLKAMKRHQKNESKWFLKLDFSNFFGSTTLPFVMNMLSMVFPFCEIVKSKSGREELEKALELGFLNGVLPQGTPLSPMLTNVMMIPIDYHVTKTLRNFNNQAYVYTRYSDDSIISSKYSFNPSDVERVFISILNDFNAPFSINTQKTRYGSSSGSNWNLGTMLNKDNNITVGFRTKRGMKAALHSYALDKKNGNPWELPRVQRLAGRISYYKMVEEPTINKMIDHVCKSVNMNIPEMIKSDLRLAD